MGLPVLDIFTESKEPKFFVGHPFYFDFSSAKILVNDKWKHQVGGIPAGAFLLCSYDNEPAVHELVLVRVLGPTPLPTSNMIIESMVEHYKERTEHAGAGALDPYTRYEYMFSGLECRVLGTFYRDAEGKTRFGADVENFYSAHNYRVFKPQGRVLEYVVNFTDVDVKEKETEPVRLGTVRYSSSRRVVAETPAQVFVKPLDFVGKRTALFGMTRTGKSNTVKKIVECSMDLSQKGPVVDGEKLRPIGQIIFDVNGEYANANQQDAGTAIFELYGEVCVRYSVLAKAGFRQMKLNFFKDIAGGFAIVQDALRDTTGDYVKSFLSISIEPPDESDFSATTRWQRLVAAYQCVLHAAGFASTDHMVTFKGNAKLNKDACAGVDPSHGLSLDEARKWFEQLWTTPAGRSALDEYERKEGSAWVDESLKSVLVMLTGVKDPGGTRSHISAFKKLDSVRKLHAFTDSASFESDIINALRQGMLVIIDLSQGDEQTQRIYAERICQRIFRDGMDRFIANEKPNYIQMYFEEAHNLFPKKEDKDLTQIYNRIAKEGAKLRIGLIYATQEPSSISANVLKNTQNWFVSHLNNADELREVEKYYDFADFADSLRMAPDRGFIRMKTFSNAFTVPVQVDRFLANRGK